VKYVSLLYLCVSDTQIEEEGMARSNNLVMMLRKHRVLYTARSIFLELFIN